MRETAISALEGVGIPADEHDRRLERYTTYPLLGELAEGDIPKMGQLVMIEGRPGIIQTWHSFCSRPNCAFRFRPFKAGQKPVPFPSRNGWAHAKIRDDTRPPEPVPEIPSSCGTCKQPFEEEGLFDTNVMATAPQHVYFDHEGKSSRCSASVVKTGLGSGSLEDAPLGPDSSVCEVDTTASMEDSGTV